MTNITLQKQHRTLWHFIPGLALSAVITGVALWGGSIPAVAGAGFSALTLAILLGDGFRQHHLSAHLEKL